MPTLDLLSDVHRQPSILRKEHVRFKEQSISEIVLEVKALQSVHSKNRTEL